MQAPLLRVDEGKATDVSVLVVADVGGMPARLLWVAMEGHGRMRGFVVVVKFLVSVCAEKAEGVGEACEELGKVEAGFADEVVE